MMGLVVMLFRQSGLMYSNFGLTLINLLYGPDHVVHKVLQIAQRVGNRSSFVDRSKRSIKDRNNILEQFRSDSLIVSTILSYMKGLTSKIKASNPSFSLLLVHNFNNKFKSSNNHASSSSGPRSSSESSISAWAFLYAL